MDWFDLVLALFVLAVAWSLRTRIDRVETVAMRLQDQVTNLRYPHGERPAPDETAPKANAPALISVDTPSASPIDIEPFVD